MREHDAMAHTSEKYALSRDEGKWPHISGFVEAGPLVQNVARPEGDDVETGGVIYPTINLDL